MSKKYFISISKSLASQFSTRKAFYFTVLGVFLCFCISSRTYNFQDLNDEEIYNKKISNANGAALDDFTLNIAKSFLNRRYKAHTLDVNTNEKLIVNLREFDCSTFVESCIAMGLTYRKNEISFDKFKYYLKRLRYYNKGSIKGYESRIHYFSDWLYTHSQDGLLEDVTPKMGGITWKKNINFMSTHWHKYPFATNTSLQEKIQKVEEKINGQNFTYIPKTQIKKIENQFLNGDIIGITTNIDGLDIAHEGFAIRLQDKRVYLLHASSDFKRVMVTDKPLVEYMAKNKTQTGIMVARLK
ncbi:N-acetylmuramoyl-L-alanine amidase-like domain-containing protein [Arcicella sp. LKC2W]|uniref:N-acetylmuramoyl-L-alanine amidase-like domain-containing protein n=1 Tax=Arcicella sp. LKC2W TaxID=2984198 RepID=UPI002B1F9CAE|nr:N-acetylmuramoyl-L-alanine amidase-like domain-containing protein [Arcicella sp. LKC2W]MEA5458433.1 N-acetylmuramoyl-L-alanine amidase-like domain-containing protein [Arcicella sp. LKC2W]